MKENEINENEKNGTGKYPHKKCDTGTKRITKRKGTLRRENYCLQ